MTIPQTKITTPLLRQSAQQAVKMYGPQQALDPVDQLLADADKNKRMYGLYLIQYAYPASLEMAGEYLPTIANDESWEVRETVAMVLRRLLEKDFDHWFTLIATMGKNPLVNVHRAAIVGSMIKKLDKTQAQKIWNLYLPHFKSKELYIKKNLGPFALAHLATKQPELTFDLMRKLAHEEHEMVRWNVLMAFSQRLGKAFPAQAQEFIQLLKSDERITVQRAVRSLERILHKGQQ